MDTRHGVCSRCSAFWKWCCLTNSFTHELTGRGIIIGPETSKGLDNSAPPPPPPTPRSATERIPQVASSQARQPPATLAVFSAASVSVRERSARQPRDVYKRMDALTRLPGVTSPSSDVAESTLRSSRAGNDQMRALPTLLTHKPARRPLRRPHSCPTKRPRSVKAGHSKDMAQGAIR